MFHACGIVRTEATSALPPFDIWGFQTRNVITQVLGLNKKEEMLADELLRKMLKNA